jgi:hypothetical protein
MENPYRRLFNLFAFSVLALALYINFVRKEDEPSSQGKAHSSYQQAKTDSKSKPIAFIK